MLDTLNQYKECVNIVLDYGFVNHITRGQLLHDATYHNLRAKYPQLPSALVCVARVRATEYLKSIKTKTKNQWDTKQPTTNQFPSIRYNSTCCAIGNESLAVTTTNGRIKLGIGNNPFVKEDVANFSKSCELSYKQYNNTWFLTVFVKVKEKEQLPTQNVLGIDRGVKNIAVCSNSQFFNSKQLRNVKGKYRYLRKKLQSKGTRSAKRLMKKLSGRENRFQKDVNHCVSKKLIALPFDTYVLEQLDVHAKKGKSRKFNTLLSNWSWVQLEQFLTYKALLVGKKVEYVDARYTSQKCSVCGYVYRGNRKTQSEFLCRNCGFQCHADLNAARNIRNNYNAMFGIASHGRVLSITRTPHNELEISLE